MEARIYVLGSGPAGLTAALYLARANLKPIVMEGEQPGGQLTTTTEVDNFPGFKDGVTGPDLMETMKAQAARFDTEFMIDHVKSIDLSQRPFVIQTVSGKELLAEALVVSTGATAKYLGLANEKRLLGYGVSACATCDGFFFQGQEIAVVGGGDTALEEALFLARFASKVTLIHRRDTLRASKAMQARAEANKKIHFLWNHTVEDVLGDESVTGLLVKNTQTGEAHTFVCTGLFLGIGHRPNTGFFNGQLDLNDAGYLITTPGSTHTNVPGVFAAGDVADPIYRQAITAAGTGCMAALDCERWLEEQKG